MLTPSSNRVLPAGAAVVIACGIAACSTTPSRTPAERAADADIANQVEAALSADPNIYARHIDVEVDRGVVHLGGYVWKNEDFQLARRDAVSVRREDSEHRDGTHARWCHGHQPVRACAGILGDGQKIKLH